MILKNKEFNVLDEPWILALNDNGDIEELSILTILERAHLFKGLAGELVAQDVAILRLLLAILHATFYREDENGIRAPLRSADEALQRWNTLWRLGRIPMDPVRKGLEKYRERFFLFHPERPFYQIPHMDKGTAYRACKLLGDLSESNNKVRLFPIRTGAAKMGLKYGEAARWLLYLNAYDDTSSKPTRNAEKKLPSPGAGWLGKIGIIFAAGGNLFETLLLNLVLLDDNGEPWEDGCAVWELAEVRTEERVQIPMPRSQAALMSLQSRRIILEREDKKIVGFRLLGGDFFDKENAFSEPMTIWRKDEKKQIYLPKRHDVSKQLWRDLPSLMAKGGGCRRPGVITWLAFLQSRGLITLNQIKMQAASVKYGDKDFFVDDVWSDSISINGAVLQELGDLWVTRIVHVLDTTDGCVRKLGNLGSDLAAAAAADENCCSGKRRAAMEQAYYRLDMPFRSWLSGINPTVHNVQDKTKEWKDHLRDIVLNLGKELVSDTGYKAFVGARRRDKQKEFINVPKAYSRFRTDINQILIR